MSTVPVSLHDSLIHIMGELGKVPKTGYNKHSNYHYASDEDIMTALQPLLIKYGITVRCDDIQPLPTTASKGGNPITNAVFTYEVSNGKERIQSMAMGSGADPTDKGAYKAMTGAFKYFWRTLLAFPVGNDAEQDTKPQGERTGSKHWDARTAGPLPLQENSPDHRQPPPAQHHGDPDVQKRRDGLVEGDWCPGTCNGGKLNVKQTRDGKKKFLGCSMWKETQCKAYDNAPQQQAPQQDQAATQTPAESYYEDN